MPLTLVGDYDSSGGEEEERTANVETADWEECFDDPSGYYYYWNVKTNEVRWDKPKTFRSRKKPAKTSSTKGSGKKAPVVYGPNPPAPSTPEEIAISRIRKFENDLADGIIRDIHKEVPADWKDSKPSSVLYESNFKWNKSQQILPSLEAKEKVKGSINAFALIGGVYGDDDDDEEEEDKGDDSKDSLVLPTPVAKKRKISVTVKPSSNKVPKNPLKPVPNAFLDQEEPISSEDSNGIEKTNFNKSAGSQYRKSIDSVAETLCDKLEALKVASIFITPLKLLAIRIETLFNAWQSGALSSSYLQRILMDMSKKMKEIESEELAPPGWKALWDSSSKSYYYENLITGETRNEKPPEEEDDDDEVQEIEPHSASDKKDETKGPEIFEIADSEEEDPPPLPPAEKDEALPPLPPDPPPSDAPPPPPLPPSTPSDSGGQVEDMELDEDENHGSHENGVIPESVEIPNNNHMDSALSSFYMDLATMNKGSASNSPPFSPSLDEDERTSPVRSETPEEGKKRKTKISSALAMKKKGVDSLVAKWKNIQEQAKKTQ